MHSARHWCPVRPDRVKSVIKDGQRNGAFQATRLNRMLEASKIPGLDD